MKGLFSEFEFKEDYRLCILKTLPKSADVIKNQTILKSIHQQNKQHVMDNVYGYPITFSDSLQVSRTNV